VVLSSVFCLDTAVVQVQAVDKDDPSSSAGRIVFSIVSTHQKFKINPTTGWISTNKVGFGTFPPPMD